MGLVKMRAEKNEQRRRISATDRCDTLPATISPASFLLSAFCLSKMYFSVPTCSYLVSNTLLLFPLYLSLPKKEGKKINSAKLSLIEFYLDLLDIDVYIKHILGSVSVFDYSPDLFFLLAYQQSKKKKKKQ